jgi:hypothetical protein
MQRVVALYFSVSSLAACALHELERRNPRVVPPPAGRRRRRSLAVLAYSLVVGGCTCCIQLTRSLKAQASNWFQSLLSKFNFYRYVAAGLTLLEFGYVLYLLVGGAWQRKEATLRRFPRLTWADVVFEKLSFSLGAAAMIPALAALLPVSVGAPLVAALGVPSSEAVRFHATLGRAAVTMFTAHGLGFTIFWLRRGDAISSLTEWAPFGVNNLAGVVSVLGALAVAAAAHPWIRRRYYEVFYYSHVIGAFVFCVFGAAHYSYAAFYFAPATLLYAADVGTRVRQHRGRFALTEVEIISRSLILLRVPLRRRDGPIPMNDLRASGAYFNLSFGRGAQAHPFSALLRCDKETQTSARLLVVGLLHTS